MRAPEEFKVSHNSVTVFCKVRDKMAEMLAIAPKNQQRVKLLEKKLEDLEVKKLNSDIRVVRNQSKDRNASAANESIKSMRGECSDFFARSKDDCHLREISAAKPSSLRSRFQTAINKLILNSKASKSQLPQVMESRFFDPQRSTDGSLRGVRSEVLSPLPSPQRMSLAKPHLAFKAHSTGYIMGAKKHQSRRPGGNQRASDEEVGLKKLSGTFKLRLSKTYLRNIFLEHRREDERSLDDSKDLEDLQKSKRC